MGFQNNYLFIPSFILASLLYFVCFFNRFLTCFICFTCIVLSTNGLNSANVSLNIKQMNKQNKRSVC